MTQVNVSTLGCFPMDATNGTTQATALANAAAINAHLATNWRSSCLPLLFPGKGWLIANTLDLQVLRSHTLLGSGGEADSVAEVDYTTAANAKGGPASRIVAEARFAVAPESGGIAGQPLIRVPGYGNLLERLVLQGRWHASSTATLNAGYPIDGTLINDATAHTNDLRCWLGIEVMGNPPTGIGSGKLCSPTTLTIMLCRAAIKCSGVPTELNADQIILQRFFAPYCDIGMWFDNDQSIAHRIAYFDQLYCDTAFRFDRGGKLWCGDLVMSGYSRYGLLITGADTDINAEKTLITVDRLTIDGNNPLPTAQCVHITPPAGLNSAPVVVINYLSVSTARADKVPLTPLLEINRCYGDINIYGGTNFYNGMIKVTGGLSTGFPTIRIFNAKFKPGHSPANIFTSDSSGYVQYEQHSCCEVHAGAGTINGGQMFPGFRGLLNFPTAPPTAPVFGGFLYQRGSMVTKTSSYTATIFDETILCNPSGSGPAVTLPVAATVPGKMYNISRLPASGAVVNIDVTSGSGDTIDGVTSYSLAPSTYAGRTVQSNGVSLWKVLYVP